MFTFVILLVKTSDLGAAAGSGSLVVALSQSISDGASKFVASGNIIDPLDVNGAAAICLPSNVGVQPSNTYYLAGLDLGGNNFDPVALVVPNTGLIPLVTGSGPPAPDVGNDGYYYFDTVAQKVYGPMASGLWPTTSVAVMGAGTNVPSGVIMLAASSPGLLGAPMITYVLTTSVGQPFGLPPLDETGQIPGQFLANAQSNIDGGNARSVYGSSQHIDGGNAHGD